MTELKRLRAVVAERAAAVERDKAATVQALERTFDRLKRDVSRPLSLLGLFGAGLVFGALRRDGTRDARKDGPREQGGMLTRTAAVLLSAARLIELTRNADRFSPGGKRGRPASVPFPDHQSDQPQQYQADDRHETGEQQLPHRDGNADRSNEQQ